jgi:hypothetical protein
MGAESHHISLHSLAHIVHISGEATSRLPSLRSRLVESTLSSSTLTSPLSSFRPTPLPSARQVDCLLFLHFVFVVHGPTATSSTSSCRVYFLIFSPLVHLPSLRTRYIRDTWFLLWPALLGSGSDFVSLCTLHR